MLLHILHIFIVQWLSLFKLVCTKYKLLIKKESNTIQFGVQNLFIMHVSYKYILESEWVNKEKKKE